MGEDDIGYISREKISLEMFLDSNKSALIVSLKVLMVAIEIAGATAFECSRIAIVGKCGLQVVTPAASASQRRLTVKALLSPINPRLECPF
jgi:hypothetical protein